MIHGYMYPFLPASNDSNPLISNTLSSLENVSSPNRRDIIILMKVEIIPTKAFWNKKK